jgi:hypothetical protein
METNQEKVPFKKQSFFPHLLIKEIYNRVLEEAPLEEDNLGMNLALLMGGIANGNYSQWPSSSLFLMLLSRLFEPKHIVWNYIYKGKENENHS